MNELIELAKATIADARKRQREHIASLDPEDDEDRDMLKAIRRTVPEKALVEITCGEMRELLKNHTPTDETISVYLAQKKGVKRFPDHIVCNVQACDILTLAEQKPPAPAK